MSLTNHQDTPSYNVNPFVDILTGTYEIGLNGEAILNGGFQTTSVILGIPNIGKTELALQLQASLNARYGKLEETFWYVFDSEGSLYFRRIEKALKLFTDLTAEEIEIQDLVVRSSQSSGDNPIYLDEWFEEIKTIGDLRFKNRKKNAVTIPIPNVRTGEALKGYRPISVLVDSLSEGKVSSVQKKTLEKNNVGSSDNLMVYASEGNAKNQYITQLPRTASMGSFVWLNTVHLGFKANFGGPYDPKPPELVHSKRGLSSKGVSEKLKFLGTVHLEIPTGSRASDSDGCFYPRTESDREKNSVDQIAMICTASRNKTGTSGSYGEIFNSQRDGIRWGITYYHFLKDRADRFGLTGEKGAQHFSFHLCPDVKLQRTTVNEIAETNPRVNKAAALTFQIAWMRKYWELPEQYKMSMEKIVESVLAQGYTIDEILDTRDWWCYVEDEHKHKNFLSAFDLLRIAAGEYKPKWKT